MSTVATIHGLKHGESAQFSAPGGPPATVTYHERQSYGDNNKRVPGAYTGTYTVELPNGKTSTFDHGPHAKTDQAARRGANPNAKGYAARQAHEAVLAHVRTAGRFNNRVR